MRGPRRRNGRILRSSRAVEMITEESAMELRRRFHHSWVRAPNKTGPTGRESIAQG